MLPHIDLNLVRVFVSVYELRSVTAAAARLCVSQPTVSYGLSKLRTLLNDPLFLKTADGMVPTLNGERIYQHFRAAMGEIENVLELTRKFDPRRSTDRFVMTMSDVGEMVFLPPLLEHIHRDAPNVELEVVQVSVDEMAAWLAMGKMDAAIGNLPSLKSQVESVPIIVERYVCVLRKNHGMIGRELTLEDFIAARHILVSSPFSGRQFVEDALRAKGVQRKIAIRISNFTTLPRLISNTDLLATVPLSLAKLFKSYDDLRIVDLPVTIPEVEIRLFWHERNASNAAHRWLRDVILEKLTGAAFEEWLKGTSVPRL